MLELAVVDQSWSGAQKKSVIYSVEPKYVWSEMILKSQIWFNVLIVWNGLIFIVSFQSQSRIKEMYQRCFTVIFANLYLKWEIEIFKDLQGNKVTWMIKVHHSQLFSFVNNCILYHIINYKNIDLVFDFKWIYQIQIQFLGHTVTGIYQGTSTISFNLLTLTM